MSEIAGFIEIFPVIPAIYTVFIYYCISKIPRRWIQFMIPPFLVLFFTIVVPYVDELDIFFLYSAIAMGVITPFSLFEKYFIVKWKVLIPGICAFMTYFLVTLIAFSYTFGGPHPLVEVFPPLGFFHPFIIHYIEGILIATISYGYLLGLERLLDYIGKKFH
jgi:hypothetical protein